MADNPASEMNPVVKEALKGGAFGLGVSSGLTYAFNSYHKDFQSMPLRFKATIISFSTIFCAILSADTAASSYPKSRAPIHLSPSSIYPYPLDTLPPSAREKHLTDEAIKDATATIGHGQQEKVSLRDKMWQHRLKLLSGVYIGGIGYTTWKIRKMNPKEPIHEVLMQSRLFAHGWSLLALLGLAYFSYPDALKRRIEASHKADWK